MKNRILAFTAMLAAFAVSCEKPEPEVPKNETDLAPGRLTASFVQTKVAYTETDFRLYQTWEVGDKIVGFDDNGNTYTLTVSSISGPTALLSCQKTVPDGPLHLIYRSGASESDISSESMALDYASQDGVMSTMPAVMLADGIVSEGSCDFEFSNAGAIVAIKNVYGVPSGSVVTKLSVIGSNLSSATVALSGSALALVATAKPVDSISTPDGLSLTVDDDKGTLSSVVYFAIPAGSVMNKISVTVSKEAETQKIPDAANGVEGNDFVSIAAKYDGTNISVKKWAKWNLGANGELPVSERSVAANRSKEYGWYFAWGATDGYFNGPDIWLSPSATSIEYVYESGSTINVSANQYFCQQLGVFDALSQGHSFDWSNAPFNNGQASFNGTYFSSVKNNVCPGNTLSLQYDAARANWGGTWRMPTRSEFKALLDATLWAWDDTDNGCYVFAPSGSDAGHYASSIPSGYSKSSALMFFPAAGYGHNSFYFNTSNVGMYWTSTFGAENANNAYSLSFAKSDVHGLYYTEDFCMGQPIRPISD